MTEKRKEVVKTDQKNQNIPGSATEHLLSRGPGPSRVFAFVIVGFVSIFSFFHLYTGFFGQLEIYINLTITVSLMLILAFLYYPLGRKSWSDPLNKWFLVDVLFILIIIAAQIYIIVEYEELIIYRTSMANTADVLVGAIYMLLILEATRRVLGYPILVLCILFLIQNFTASWWPGWLHGTDIPLKISVEVNFIQDNGIFGVPVKVCSQYLVLFLIFVSMLLESGAGQKLLNLSLALAGRLSGGPAKVAVIGSSLLGSVQGAATANVAGTGSFTIPLMKKSGFSANMAGAVESVASSGAQLMPPIMGASAFVMAGFLGVSYTRICLAAIIPALIFYVCIFATIHFYSIRNGFTGMPKAELPSLGKSLKEGWSVIIPFAVLIFYIVKGVSLSVCASNGIIAVIICTMIDPSTRWTPVKLLKTLESGARQCIVVVIACTVAGVIIGTFFVSGLGDNLARQIVMSSHGILPVALIICAVVSLILGMAMPTVAVYITLLLVAVPALIKMGVPEFSAHFFCFYFGLLSAITPPVALAAFVAAGISGDSPMKTALTASRIAMPLYVVAFFLPYNAAMTWGGSAFEILTTAVLGIVGAIAVAASTAGFFIVKVRYWERIIFLIGGLSLLGPFISMRLAGVGLIILCVFTQKMQQRKSDDDQGLMNQSKDYA